MPPGATRRDDLRFIPQYVHVRNVGAPSRQQDAAVLVAADGSRERRFYTFGLHDAWTRNDVRFGYVWPVRGGP